MAFRVDAKAITSTYGVNWNLTAPLGSAQDLMMKRLTELRAKLMVVILSPSIILDATKDEDINCGLNANIKARICGQFTSIAKLMVNSEEWSMVDPSAPIKWGAPTATDVVMVGGL